MVATPATNERRLITGGDPDQYYPVPVIETAWSLAPDLELIAQALIKERFPLLQNDLDVTYLWRAHGATKRGKPTYGGCEQPSGLLGYFSNTDFVIWLAADQIDASPPFSRWQVEAELYKQLCYIFIDPEDGSKGLRTHDVEAFRSEIAHYGFWEAELAAMAQTVQRKLPGFSPEREFEILPPPSPVRPGDEHLHAVMAGLDDADLPDVEAPVSV